jgi:hypothetical protein
MLKGSMRYNNCNRYAFSTEMHVHLHIHIAAYIINSSTERHGLQYNNSREFLTPTFSLGQIIQIENQ